MSVATSPRRAASPAPLATVSRTAAGDDLDWERERRVLAARTAAEADLAFGDLIEPAVLECLAQEAIDELWDGPLKVTAFVPLLALRRIREKVAEAHGVGRHPTDM